MAVKNFYERRVRVKMRLWLFCFSSSVPKIDWIRMDSVFGKWEKRRCSTHREIVKLGSALQFIDPLLSSFENVGLCYSETWWEETPTQVTISTPSSHTLKNEGIFLTKLILHRRLWETHVFFKKLRKIKSTLSFSWEMQILAPWWKTCKLKFYY